MREYVYRYGAAADISSTLTSILCILMKASPAYALKGPISNKSAVAWKMSCCFKSTPWQEGPNSHISFVLNTNM